MQSHSKVTEIDEDESDDDFDIDQIIPDSLSSSDDDIDDINS